ncbi:MAG: hypothetical protein CMG64_06735 [Candidatus Marinimicrobia bacterium]|nr:hypothetical protein [Candidatus Neomarinimicrobiota bacterium]|tara:strand:- start:96 stop:542 length:447 start_codon:yes stop_codon:yes gene_type:complete
MLSESFASIQLHLDKQGKDSLIGLARWSKVLGLINFSLGIFNGITSIPLLLNNGKIFIISIPSLLFSGILMYMGLQLNRASQNIRNSIVKEHDQEFLDGLIKIQKFFFFSTILYLVGFILLFLMLSLGPLSNESFPSAEQIDTIGMSI